MVDGAAGVLSPLHQSTGLSFEQQEELLLLQIEHEKLNHEAEVEKQLTLEKMKYETEQARVTLERERLIREGRLGSEADQGPGGDGVALVPETFFSLFERVADARRWPDSERTVMLQCVLTGKALFSFVSDG